MSSSASKLSLETPALFGLFTRGEDDAPVVFSMPFGKRRKSVRAMVQAGGGALADPGERDERGDRLDLVDPHALLPADVRLVAAGRTDFFSAQYVKDCVEANRLLPELIKYRLNKNSRFQKYDPMDVLLGFKKWSDIPKKSSDDGGDEEGDHSSEGEACSEIDVGDADDRVAAGAAASGAPPKPWRPQPKSRMPYTRQDQVDLLRHIVRRRLYNDLKGNEVWKMMEKDQKLCSGRSWQSLKEHFRKQIMPQVGTYDLSQKQVSLLKRAWEQGEKVLDLTSDEDEDRDDADGGQVAPGTPKKPGPSRSSSPRKRTPAKSPSRPPASKRTGKSQVNGDSAASKISPVKARGSQAEANSDRTSPADGRSPRQSSPAKERTAKNKGGPTKKSRRKMFTFVDEAEPVMIQPPESERTERSKRRRKASNGGEKPAPPPPPPKFPELPVEVEKEKGTGTRGAAKVSGTSLVAAALSPARDGGRRRRTPSTSSSSDRTDISMLSTSSINRYSAGEDEAIAVYVRDNGYLGSWKGRAMWEKMERNNVVPGRSWQSMKNRFKHILKDKGVAYFKAGLTAASGEEDQQSEKAAATFQKNAYTKEEDLSILNYLVVNRGYRDVKGKAMWELMERRKVGGGRSWQSLKERFLKRIRPNLDRYETLTDREKALLRTAA